MPILEIERIRHRINRTESGCWEWTGATNGVGYGIVTIQRRRYYVHRLVYSLFVDAIPHGHVVDHLCRNTLCCCPEHLEAITPSQNALRSPLIGLKFNCKNGHLFDEANTYITPQGARRCRRCAATRARHDRRRNHAHS